MDLIEGPTALGVIIMSVALGAWALGRWQSGAATVSRGDAAPPALTGAEGPRDMPVPVDRVPAASSPPTASAGRRSAFYDAVALGELHAEISAYRRAQQVLATLDSDPLHLTVLPQAGLVQCRHQGLIGEPICALPRSVRPASGCGSGCAGYTPRSAAQRSVQPSERTRV